MLARREPWSLPSLPVLIVVLLAPPLTAIIGLIVERVLIRPLYGRDPLYSLLLTFGLVFVVSGVA